MEAIEMWERVAEVLVCPGCHGALALRPLAARPADAGSEDRWIDTGVLTCEACKSLYPVHRGVPILLRYATMMAQMALKGWPLAVRTQLSAAGYDFPRDEPPPGEKFVCAAFSTEWEDYDYGPTLWTASTAERLETFRGECGLAEGDLRGKRFCEVGCGLGILTHEAAATLGAESFGIDLSTSVFRAASQFRDNTHVHFIQASVFAAPFRGQDFDFVYSHGVLHHTFNTQEAVRHAAGLVRPGGGLYVWLYGYEDVRVSMPRRLAFALEQSTRPWLARLPPRVATGVLLPLVPVYQAASLLGRLSGSHGATYSAQQAIHAARDRFTPLYAHRHEYEEVADWYREIGLHDLHRVSGTEVSPSWAPAIERNVSIRGWR
jgi:2-polyprenyl-3-methyl-5-hydroxy-6-metoxy-1,4-benzoquinol methylase